MPRSFLMQFKKKKKVQVVYQEDGTDCPENVDVSDSSEDEGLEASPGSGTGHDVTSRIAFRESENSAFSRIRPASLSDGDSSPKSAFQMKANAAGFVPAPGMPPPEGPLDLTPNAPAPPSLYEMYGRELDPYMGLSRYEGALGYPASMYSRPSFMAYTDPRLPITNYYLTMARMQLDNHLRQRGMMPTASVTELTEEGQKEDGEKTRAISPVSSQPDSGRDSPEEEEEEEEEDIDVDGDDDLSDKDSEAATSPQPDDDTKEGPQRTSTPETPVTPKTPLTPHMPFLHLPHFPPHPQPPMAHHHPQPHHTMLSPEQQTMAGLTRVPTMDYPGLMGNPFGSPPGLVHPAFFPLTTPPSLSSGGGPGRQRDPSKPPPLKKYKCDVCCKAFSRSNTLVTHKRIHTGEKPFKCELCGRAFRQPGNLTRHRLTHTTVKPYVCPRCNKAFNRASNLHTHMRTHSNYKPFVCPYCGKGFHQKIDMKIHSYTHTGEKPQRFAISR